ncbi:MAG TPA: hypothetical protein DCS07_07915 [Bdellovibrionales bacterium]|nr:MAG: hypothetical protein A2Z97_13430 [Bdellovibrionales bacterium GWB1_52_6]OFZ03170.1 MAG: hypothetical protein A2X97_04100 [Bdellovibrionales bacterium GWA1_52_35]OFZ37685.1 MAG: hypothetical protein A2070_01885 [Bdellovibrionales bacterium GWC1_52_8]HAR42542.1 hypothetical protein [Bdellovibrionales bacterium]HCM38336.1 hypothetical protein [Bdellovibrionales bacterium]
MLLEKKKQEIMRVLKGGDELGMGSVVRSGFVAEAQAKRKQSSKTNAPAAEAAQDQAVDGARSNQQAS